MPFLTTAVAFLVLLGVLITVHELGHFLVAKACGVKVLTFSLGFGPTLVSLTRGDTEYRIAMLPLGGYVRMFGDDISAEVPEGERHLAYLEKSYPQKMAIAFAGPAANLLLALVVYFGLAVAGETVIEPVAGSVLVGEPADVAGIKAGDRIVAIEGTPVASFNDMSAAVSGRAGQPTRLTVERPGAAAPLEITATPASTTSPDPRVTAPVGRLGLLAAKALPIVTAADGSAAKAAGVVFGDRIIDVDGVAVATRDDLFARLAAIAPTAAIKLTVERTDDKGGKSIQALVIAGVAAAVAVETADDDEAAVAVAVARPIIAPLFFAVLDKEVTGSVADTVAATDTVVVAAVLAQQQRRGIASVEAMIDAVEPESPADARHLEAQGHRIVAVDGKPIAFSFEVPGTLSTDIDGIHVIGLVDKLGNGSTFVLRLQPIKADAPKSQKIFGARLTSTMGGAVTHEQAVGVVDGAQRAVVATWNTIKAVAGGYAMLFSGQVGVDELGGTVMLANIAGDAARAGFVVFAGLLALISVNLAVLNLLPVPILDGGHMLLFTIEAVRRKRLSVDARAKATWIGLIFVGALMILANGNDLYKLITGQF